MNKSQCCKAEVEVHGSDDFGDDAGSTGTTMYNVCKSCSQACNVTTNKPTKINKLVDNKNQKIQGDEKKTMDHKFKDSLEKYKKDMKRVWGSEQNTKTDNILKEYKINVTMTVTQFNDSIDEAVKARDAEWLEKIDDYSSASSRAENDYYRGVSAGIEMFRKYLLRKMEK